MTNADNNHEQVSFTKEEWTEAATSTAFGLAKAKVNVKPKVAGMKAILVHDESFKRCKGALKFFTDFRPALDLPELISAMIDVCTADAEVMKKVQLQILTQREKSLLAMRAQFESKA
jgi:uncharacterized protein YdhG (YjbR/CyaY superfamily)